MGKKPTEQKVFRFIGGKLKMAIFADNLSQARRYIKADRALRKRSLKFQGVGDPSRPEDNWVAANAKGY